MNETVEIHHPGRGKTIKVPSRLFPGRLAAKGWQRVGLPYDPAEFQDLDIPLAAEPEPTPDQLNDELDEKTRLRTILDDRGVEYDGRLGIKRLRQLVEQTA